MNSSSSNPLAIFLENPCGEQKITNAIINRVSDIKFKDLIKIGDSLKLEIL
jgi:hypothetical protein